MGAESEAMLVTLDLTQVLLAIVAALSTIATAYLVSLSKKTERVETKIDVVEKTVNSNYQAMGRDLKVSNDLLADAVLQIATLTERARSADIATAKAQGMSEGILLPSPVQGSPHAITITNGPTDPKPVPVEIIASDKPIPVETEEARKGKDKEDDKA